MESEYRFSNRRLRFSGGVRSLVSQNTLHHKNFIQPIFVSEAATERSETMPNVFIETKDSILKSIEADIKCGVKKFLLFPIPQTKELTHQNHVLRNTFANSVVKKIKDTFKDQIVLILDVCLCAFSESGHCGIVDKTGSYILNSKSVEVLSKMALMYAQNGADMIAPSDMMDGRIEAIRNILDENRLDFIPIMSYSTKFCSNLYGPFRDTCSSSPSSGQGQGQGQGQFKTKVSDRKSYQIDYMSTSDALLSSIKDGETADILMVKPATYYLDVITKLKELVLKPIAAYHVSGEYVANELLAKNGYAKRDLLHTECWTAISRSGADIIISYASRNAKEWLQKIYE